MDLNKEIRETIAFYCGGTFENRKLAADKILQICKKKPLTIHSVVSSAFAKEMYSKINESTRNHKGRNTPQIFKDDALEMVEDTVALINSKHK